MKSIIMAGALLAVLMIMNTLHAAEDSLETYRVLVTANAQAGDICGPSSCGDNLNPEQLADRIAEQVVLMLYRFEKKGASLTHQYERQGNSFLWKKADEIKKVCDAGRYDAVLSINIDGTDESVGSREKRDLWIKWVDCTSLDVWNESIPVVYGTRGWDFRQQIYKYLDVVFPYFVDQ